MMSVRSVLAASSIVGLLYACVGVTPDEALCARACAAASDCGLLPSALGGRVGASRRANEEDCLDRCVASDRDSRQVAGLLEVLAADRTDADVLCSPQGTNRCIDLVEALETTATTTELNVTSAVTVRMTSAVSHAANFSIRSLCCFDYGDESKGDVIDSVSEMFGPTHDCLHQTSDRLGLMRDLLLPEDPETAPDIEQANMVCGEIRDLWALRGPMEEPDLESDPCFFARQSLQAQAIGLPDEPSECPISDPQVVDELRQEVGETLRDFNLQTGGTLVDENNEVRGVEQIRLLLEESIDDELDRPMGFLFEACDDFDCDAAAEVEPCSEGPVCNAADCLDESTWCDTTLCVGETTPPAQDCTKLGVTEVRLGYRNEQGLEVLGDPIVGCQTESQLETTFGEVGVGLITPIALVSGVLPSAFFREGAPIVGDGSYTWSVEGDPRWVSAGEAVLTLPSPMLGYLLAELQNPLEYLGWVPRRVPLGADCANQPRGCEGYFNDNCDDGVDNDANGLTDDEDPWCDDLFSELIDRCIVDEPGGSPRPECADRAEPPDLDD